jgi:oligoendopeptidase F
MSSLVPPRWNLTNVFPGLESREFGAAFEAFRLEMDEIEHFIQSEILPAGIDQGTVVLSALVQALIQRLNQALRNAGTLRAYLNSFVSTDSYNNTAMRLNSEYEQVGVRLQKANIQVINWIGKIASAVPEIIQADSTAQAHAFYLNETIKQSHYQMSPAEEALAAELNLSGASAWGKMQGTVTSQLSVPLEIDGKVQNLPMPALINLHSHPDTQVRQRAYEAEMAAWEKVKQPLAAALNGIKGTVNTLNRHRGRQDALHSALDIARIDRQTLEVMLDAMQASFPMFRKYFRAKAARLGKEQLPWWDIFAPSGKNTRTYTFDEGRDFILANFERFSPDLSNFARRAFDHHWIDAEQRDGKRGGAFCMSVPGVQESRILCNFDGSLDQVSTVAHELGHGFHNHCMFEAGKTEIQRITPMTMAETASIMCETIIIDAALKDAASPDTELAILETALVGDAQVIVDIYSRYLFEKEVFERRVKAELSPEELGEIMERAQKATYGDALDERYLHKYMWTWKPHYYSASLSFYNFPYAFGLLFGIGLYAIYQQRGAAFVPDYKNLLSSTGEAAPAELAARFGIDIRQPSFWEGSLDIIGKRIERYTRL